jgi:hypothetical protein
MKLWVCAFENPGPVRAQRAPDGPQKALWSHFGVPWPGSGPEREPQMGSRRLSGATLGAPGPGRAQRAPDGSQEALWNHFGPPWLRSGPGSLYVYIYTSKYTYTCAYIYIYIYIF